MKRFERNIQLLEKLNYYISICIHVYECNLDSVGFSSDMYWGTIPRAWCNPTLNQV